MKVTEEARRRTRVPLPADVTRPFEVFVNGVPQVEGHDYVVRSGALVFDRELRSEGKLGAARWTSMVLGVAGTYKQNDSVDVVYDRDGRRVVASKLPLEAADRRTTDASRGPAGAGCIRLAAGVTQSQHVRNASSTVADGSLTSPAFYSLEMSTQTSPAYVRHEWDDVVSWRIERLLTAGYDEEAAVVLALDRDVDLHQAVVAPRARLPRRDGAADSVLGLLPAGGHPLPRTPAAASLGVRFAAASSPQRHPLAGPQPPRRAQASGRRSQRAESTSQAKPSTPR